MSNAVARIVNIVIYVFIVTPSDRDLLRALEKIILVISDFQNEKLYRGRVTGSYENIGSAASRVRIEGCCEPFAQSFHTGLIELDVPFVAVGVFLP